MTFLEFLAAIRKLKLDEERVQTADYLEVVIARDVLAGLTGLLTARFGPALKPEGELPSGESNRLAKPYGGIRKNQTMYFRQDGDLFEYVFLWPWEGGARITVKVIQAQASHKFGSGWKDLVASIFGGNS